MKPYYAHAGVMIYHGDCREILLSMEAFSEGHFDALVTDPPYGISYAADPIHHERNHVAMPWDDEPLSRRFMYQLLDRTLYQIIWGGHYYELPPARCCLVWHKPDSPPSMSDVEIAWTNLRQPSRQFTWSIAATNKERVGHPNQKPQAVMRWALGFLPSGCLVLDPFAGSGTTLVECKRLGLRAVGIEREERYCEIAAQRLQQEALPLERVG